MTGTLSHHICSLRTAQGHHLDALSIVKCIHNSQYYAFRFFFTNHSYTPQSIFYTPKPAFSLFMFPISPLLDHVLTHAGLCHGKAEGRQEGYNTWADKATTWLSSQLLPHSALGTQTQSSRQGRENKSPAPVFILYDLALPPSRGSWKLQKELRAGLPVLEEPLG